MPNIAKITPPALYSMIAKADITQARAAYLCHASTRSMEQWLAGDKGMPRSATALLAWSLYWLGLLAAEDVRPWLRDDVYHMAFVVGN
jgi:hypothetical protein